MRSVKPEPLEQPDLLPVEHRGLHPKRLKRPFNREWGSSVNAEAFFAAAWMRENKRSPGINRGFTALEWILCPDGRPYPGPVSRRDAAVAASVVQWFGTNCGSAFLDSVQKEIAKAREQVRAVGWPRRRAHREREAAMEETPLQRRKRVLDESRARLTASAGRLPE